MKSRTNWRRVKLAAAFLLSACLLLTPASHPVGLAGAAAAQEEDTKTGATSLSVSIAETEGSPVTFVSVSAGLYHACGLKTDGSVICWGDDSDGQATPPSGAFVAVSAGRLHTCGVKTDGAVACWGFNKDFFGDVVGQATPPAGKFVSVSAGGSHTCGVRTDGSVACWGYEEGFDGDELSQAAPGVNTAAV